MSISTEIDTSILDALDFDVPLLCEVMSAADLRCGVTAEWILRCFKCGHACLHCYECWREKVAYLADGGTLICSRCGNDVPDFIKIGKP